MCRAWDGRNAATAPLRPLTGRPATPRPASSEPGSEAELRSIAFRRADGYLPGTRTAASSGNPDEEMTMAWTTPTLVEICIGLEINGYLPAEF